MAADAQSRTRLGRVKMLLVLLVCASPVIASYFTYYVVRPDGRRNFGELIETQRPLPDVVATSLQGQAVNLQTLKGQWLLLSVAGGACGALYASVTGLGATGTGVTGIFGILLHLHMPLQYLIMMAISFGVSFAVTWEIWNP